MAGFTDVFGGSTLFPSEVSYLAVALSAADIVLEWPLESNAPTYPAARILDVTSANSRVITLPDATLASPGQTILFNCLAASTSSFTVKDSAGGTVATVTAGTSWQVYLAGTATAAGTWRKYQAGASTATVQASDLSGYGLTVTGSTLSQSMPVSSFTMTPYVLLTTDRAKLIVWSGSGAGAVTLLATATAGANYFVSFRNESTGTLTLNRAGSDLIDGDTSLVLQPTDSVTLGTDGTNWFGVGLGQQPIFAFDYTVISLAGLSGTYTLSGSELNRIAYSFTGALAGNITIVVPPTYQMYWVSNDTTGAYTLGAKVSGGTAVLVTQSGRSILYSNGANVVSADTASIGIPLPASQGGTGQTSYTVGDLLYASGATTLSKLVDVATGNALISGGVGVAPSWGKITLTTHVAGVLPEANGGTNQSTYTTGDILYASASNTLSKLADVATGNALIAGGIGVAPSWGKIVLTTSVSGTLPVANGGTGITSLGAGVATWLGTPSSANLASALTDKTGTGSSVFATSPTLITPALGTPSSGVLTSCTGLPISTGLTGVGTGVLTALSVNVGSAGAFVTFNGALGTPSSGTLTSCTGLPISTGVSGLGAGVATALAIAPNAAGGFSTKITEANNSISVGTGAGGTSGANNVSLGSSALAAETTATRNIAIGRQALLVQNVGGAAIAGNVAVGSFAGAAISNGLANTLFGDQAGTLLTTGNYNTQIGGYQGAAAQASMVALSDGQGTRKFWHDNTDAFVLHATTANVANAVLDSSSKALQRSTSSLRYKNVIGPVSDADAEAFLKLTARNYTSKCPCDDPKAVHIGFIAEEADAIDALKPLVTYGYAPEDYDEPDENNERWPKKGAKKVPDGFGYDRSSVYLQMLVKQLFARIAVLEAKVGI